MKKTIFQNEFLELNQKTFKEILLDRFLESLNSL